LVECLIVNGNVNYLDDTMTALADPVRRRTIEVLGSGPLRASDLAEAAGMSRPAMSRHLRVLRTSGLVEVALSPTDAREHVYRLREDRLVALAAWIDQVRASWNDQLERFRTHVEQSVEGRS
jgi:DNA-binding transcriptional ArsR family regulator